MQNRERNVCRFAAFFATAALLATVSVVVAQSGDDQKKQPPPRHTTPRITGTVVRWINDRIELKTPEGKIQKVAVNKETKREVDIKEGLQVTVEYRRKIGEFLIAVRVLPAEEGAPAAPPGPAVAAGPAPAVTGSVVSWNAAALLLRTDAGDVTLYLAPSTRYEVKSLDPGLLVTVEYKEDAKGAKLATLVRTVEKK